MNTLSTHAAKSQKKRATHTIALDGIGEVELRAIRRNVPTFTKMFTFGRGRWEISQADVIAKYGNRDNRNRQAPKCMVGVKPNAQGLYLDVTKNALQLRDSKRNTIAPWKSDTLMQYFSQKLPSVILVVADTRHNRRGT